MPYTILLFKTLAVCVFAIGIRGTMPRYRMDQLMSINWKLFIFVWLFYITCLVFLTYML